MDRLAAMEVFRAVVEREGFSAAARVLGISPATATRQVQALEDHLGVRLLNRTTRAVSPTDAGRSYYQRCVELLDDLAETEAALRQSQEVPRGVVRLTVPMSYGLSHLAPALARFSAPWPELTLDVRYTDRTVDIIGEGVDLALRVTRQLSDSSLIVVRLGSVRRILCASPAWVAEHGPLLAPQDLAHHRCLVYTGQELPDRWTLHGPDGPVAVRVPVAIAADSSLALRDAARAGLGPCYLPGFLAEQELAEGRLVAMLEEWEEPPFPVCLLYPPGRFLTARVRLLIEFLKDEAAAGRLGVLPR